MPAIGFLSSRSPGEPANLVAAFRQGVSEAGFVEGQNAIVAGAEGHYDRSSEPAAELVELRVAVLFTARWTTVGVRCQSRNPDNP